MESRDVECKLRVLISSLPIAVLWFVISLGQNIAAQPARPISSVLNADGSIKLGISGSFDPKGFRMATGPDGSPRFISEAEVSRNLSPNGSCIDGWDDRFSFSGADTTVFTTAVDSDGNL